VAGQWVEATTAGDDVPRAAGEANPDDDPEPGERGPHRGNVGPTRGDSAASWDDEDDDEPEDEDDPTAAPPEFFGAKGRRRRMDGPRITLLNFKDVSTLSRFVTEQGKILPKRTTKVTARFQRQLGTAVKRARYLALLPYTGGREA
jgi:small subunit ribosomal protein S18